MQGCWSRPRVRILCWGLLGLPGLLAGCHASTDEPDAGPDLASGATDAGADLGPGDAGTPGDTGAPGDTGRPGDGGPGPDAGATDLGPSPDTGPSGDPTIPLATLRFAPPEPWADPIDDYLIAGAAATWVFLRGIHDLVVYRDRLYLGYGDANANLGRVIPIEIRSCDAASPPACTGEFTTAEEQIDRYRLFGDSLFIAGIDATEDGFLGNVYSRTPETDWQESRTLRGGVHVHDVAEFGGEIYAVGSGADAEEWTAGEIFAHFWVSRDRGTTFEVLERHGNEGQGDARWVRLLPLGDRLYLFGYQTDAQGDLWRLPHAVYDGETVELLPTGHPFRRLFVTETDLLGDGTALVRGIDVSVSPTRAVLWVVDAEGQPVSLTQFAGWEILDAALHAPTGEVVLLAQDASDEWPRAEYQVAAWACPVISMNNCTELFNFSSRTGPASLVAWRGALYLGTARGQIWRSVGVAPDE